MTGSRKPAFIQRPSDPEAWVRAPDRAVIGAKQAFTARLTIDVTPAMRGRLKIIAFRNGQTVADMLRALLEREFPDDGDAS
ncbi:MAG: hypothetical protein ACI9LT_001000 [Pseudoalteromonas distincta]|jgi:hypothetical protein